MRETAARYREHAKKLLEEATRLDAEAAKRGAGESPFPKLCDSGGELWDTDEAS